jgi:hypothetical protein
MRLLKNFILAEVIKMIKANEATRSKSEGFDYRKFVLKKLLEYGNQDNIYVHFSDLNKVGIRPTGKYRIRGALYTHKWTKDAAISFLFSAYSTHISIDKRMFADRRKYIHILRAAADINTVLEADIMKRYSISRITKGFYNATDLTRFLRDDNIDAVISPRENAPDEVIFVNPRKYKQIDTFINPHYKEDVPL